MRFVTTDYAHQIDQALGCPAFSHYCELKISPSWKSWRGGWGPDLSRSREKPVQGSQSSLARCNFLLGERADKSLIRTGAAGASLTGSTALRFFVMPKALDEIAKEAMDLPPRQRLALAEFLLESAEAAADPEAEAGRESEIRDPIRAIGEDRVVVMREAEKRLSP